MHLVAELLKGTKGRKEISRNAKWGSRAIWIQPERDCQLSGDTLLNGKQDGE